MGQAFSSHRDKYTDQMSTNKANKVNKIIEISFYILKIYIKISIFILVCIQSFSKKIKYTISI